MNSTHSRGWTALVPLLVIAAFVGILVLTTGPDAAPSNAKPATSVDDVAGDPARYAGRQLVLSGTVAHMTGGQGNAFVLVGDGGGRLVVTPGTRKPPADGTAVDVRAFVRTPDAGSDRAKLVDAASAAALLDAVRIVKRD